MVYWGNIVVACGPVSCLQLLFPQVKRSPYVPSFFYHWVEFGSWEHDYVVSVIEGMMFLARNRFKHKRFLQLLKLERSSNWDEGGVINGILSIQQCTQHHFLNVKCILHLTGLCWNSCLIDILVRVFTKIPSLICFKFKRHKQNGCNVLHRILSYWSDLSTNDIQVQRLGCSW